jgi:hypothetical protein
MLKGWLGALESVPYSYLVVGNIALCSLYNSFYHHGGLKKKVKYVFAY